MRYHCCLDIDNVLSWPDSRIIGLFTDENNNPAHPSFVRQVFLERKAAGHIVYALGCDSVDEQGHCTGHKEVTPHE